MNIKRLCAFTLAETLVVMGIIGVVAALTIPNLNQSTGDSEKVAKVKKIYSNLCDAFGRATAVYGPIDTWQFSGSPSVASNMIGERITEFLKMSKNWELNKGQCCFASGKSKTLDDGEYIDMDNAGLAGDVYRIITADGTSMLFSRYDPTVYVDIDGPNKGSNTWGKDLFSFDIDIDNNAIIPTRETAGFSKDGPGTFEALQDGCFKKGRACAGLIIETGNMDYLKADRDGECPNGTQLSWDNTSCK